ncbi:hypothetical protein LOZ42_002436 [Ophidiomyces ophidiicola]|nr:hypothetical protein LOZ42_002436 [Ophidiomyces ophidiicola]
MHPKPPAQHPLLPPAAAAPDHHDGSDPDATSKPSRARFALTKKKTLVLALLLLFLLAAGVAAGTAVAVTKKQQAAAAAAVCRDEDGCRDIGYARYKGTTDRHGVASWLGMRFAAPPLGALRFAAPQDPVKESAVQPANDYQKACLSTSRTANRLEAEDCLFLHVFAPANASRDAKLPVYFFIQGGGFNMNANTRVNASGLIQAAAGNLVVVSFNYRVGLYGFLASKEIQDQASLNNGLKDQIKALEWVRKHIARFGGDPNHVVIGGHSAGGASVVFHLTAYGGTTKVKPDKPLFHGVIAGSPSMGNMLNVSESQYMYDSLTNRTGCNDDADSLGCLRKLSAEAIQAQNIKLPLPGATKLPLFMYAPTIDGDLVPDYTYRLIQEGKFLRVPIVFGDDENEGTLFAPKGTSSVSQTNDFLRAQFPALTDDHLARINAFYPKTESHYPNSGKAWRRLANIYGDMRYTCPKIAIAQRFSEFHDPRQVWSYRYAVEDPIFMQSGLGTPHTAELEGIWGPDYASARSPVSYYTTNKPIVPVVQGFWSSFIRTLDPNPLRAPGSPDWNSWNASGAADPAAATGSYRELLLKTGSTKMRVVDPGLRERCDYMISIAVGIKQ